MADKWRISYISEIQPDLQAHCQSPTRPTLQPKLYQRACKANAQLDIAVNLTEKMTEKIRPVGNFSYPSSAAAVVFGVHLSARAAFRLDRKSPAVRTCV